MDLAKLVACGADWTEESYLDPRTGSFDRDLHHKYAEWEALQPDFAYHGLNVYAYLLDRYKFAEDVDGTAVENTAEDRTFTFTFDFVTVQLYEGYSHAEYNITVNHIPAEQYLQNFVRSMITGWQVDFSTDSALGYAHTSVVSVDKTRLIVGLANGWAGDGKFLLVYPNQVTVCLRVECSFSVCEYSAVSLDAERNDMCFNRSNALINRC
jgi:hypothetical protein